MTKRDREQLEKMLNKAWSKALNIQRTTKNATEFNRMSDILAKLEEAQSSLTE
jgi:hypothetical protein